MRRTSIEDWESRQRDLNRNKYILQGLAERLPRKRKGRRNKTLYGSITPE